MFKICSCANPECIKNGCIAERAEFDIIKSQLDVPLSEQDIRRIVREELDSVNKKVK